MKPEDLKKIEDAICETIEKVVNGKIDRLDEKFDAKFKEHETKMQPIYQAYQATDTFGKLVIWLSKVIAAIGFITAAITAVVKYFKQ